eukprot:CAMPEP_0169191482 /NCGR_PEP_ID=MMETSP1016-20121227/5099_1 /TAXON_ID=342587 /ORGANISM="Karlodinium micrum, Strain CCMP2283" /LENGTH=156 /DNA_ID=CAMNT_0009267747 /DNA_START=147 /DNA_END=616 /DNA_ORIENTATION=-
MDEDVALLTSLNQSIATMLSKLAPEDAPRNTKVPSPSSLSGLNPTAHTSKHPSPISLISKSLMPVPTARLALSCCAPPNRLSTRWVELVPNTIEGYHKHEDVGHGTNVSRTEALGLQKQLATMSQAARTFHSQASERLSDLSNLALSDFSTSADDF